MTPEEVIELAKQAGGDKTFLIPHDDTEYWVFTDSELQRFAELVGNAKLEEVAIAFDKSDRPIVTTVEAAWIIRNFK